MLVGAVRLDSLRRAGDPVTRYEDTAPRLVEAAAQGRWYVSVGGDLAPWVSVRTQHGNVSLRIADIVPAAGEPTAQLLAYHHPARVVALAAVVRAARGVVRHDVEPDLATAIAALDRALRRLDEEA